MLLSPRGKTWSSYGSLKLRGSFVLKVFVHLVLYWLFNILALYDSNLAVLVELQGLASFSIWPVWLLLLLLLF